MYSHQPICVAVLAAKMHFIFTCKPDSHKTLYGYVEGLRNTDMLNVVEVSRWTGRRREFDTYVYSNQLPLRDSKDALSVNWCELVTTDNAEDIGETKTKSP